jgi:hypothetical protein
LPEWLRKIEAMRNGSLEALNPASAKIRRIPIGRYGIAMTMTRPAESRNARDRLLNAAVCIVRQKGYHATSVDELCAAANVTKGAFFHHFKSK